jgi:Protein of unknown function (DUF3429)
LSVLRSPRRNHTTTVSHDPIETGSPMAQQLGLLALLPFVVGAALVWFVRMPAQAHVAAALSAYAAVVVAFIGGVHWGFGFLRPAAPPLLFVWGVVPALVACVAVLMPPRAGLVVHGGMLVVCYLVDRRVYAEVGAGRWLLLRFRLSVVASLACFIGAAGA